MHVIALHELHKLGIFSDCREERYVRDSDKWGEGSAPCVPLLPALSLPQRKGKSCCPSPLGGPPDQA